MAAPAVGLRGGWTPPQNASVNWSHPLAQGLVGVGCGFSEWGRRTMPGVGPSTPWVPTPTPWGIGLDGAATSINGAYSFQLPSATTSTQMTLVVGALCPAAGLTGGALGWGDGAGGQGAFIGLGNGSLDSDGLFVVVGESAVSWRDSAVQVAEGWNQVGWAADKTANAATFYANGREIATSGAAYNDITAASYISYGGEGAANRWRRGSLGVWHVYSRRLSNNEMARLYVDPFEMIAG